MTPNAFDTGNLAFMLVAAALVLVMTPGLAFFYGGLIGRKNVVAIMIQSFVSMGWATFVWWACGFSLVFSGGEGGVIGNFHYAFLSGVRPDTLITVNAGTPSAYTMSLLVLFIYQMMFAIITPALITGAFANRIKFPAYMIFLTLWMFCVYFPAAHMVWGNGLFAKWGVLDFAGGTAVHTTAGFAALASVVYVGKRKFMEKGPHNIPFVALGAALLWFGWYGFNAGSELHADATAVVAFVNTDIDRLRGRHHLALPGVALREEAQVRRPAHRRRGRPGGHHPRRRLREPHRRGLHRRDRQRASATWRSN